MVRRVDLTPKGRSAARRASRFHPLADLLGVTVMIFSFTSRPASAEQSGLKGI